MASVTVQVEANADDGYRLDSGGGFAFDNSAAYASIGALNMSEMVRNNARAWGRLPATNKM